MRLLARRCSASIQTRTRMGATTHATSTSVQSGTPAMLMSHKDSTRPRLACFLVRLIWAWLLCVVLVSGRTASADLTAALERPQYDIRVAVDVTQQRVTLHELIRLPDWDSPVLWLYADRLRERPPSLDEIESERIFPVGIELGGFGSLTVRVEGCPTSTIPSVAHADPHRGRDVPLSICPTASRPLRLEIEGTLVLPLRYGTLGAARDTVTLADPFYPLVLRSAADTVPPLADHVVHVAPLDERIVASANGVVSVDEAHPVAAIEQNQVTHAPLVVLPPTRSFVEDQRAGIRLQLVTDRREMDVRHLFPVEGNEPADQGDHWDVDAAGLLHGTLLDCIALLRRMGFTRSERPRVRGLAPTLTVVEIPERQRLAIEAPGMLLVSDHAFRITPTADRTRRLHGRPVARRAFTALIAPHLAATSTRQDAPWVGDLDGSLLVERLLVESSAAKGGAKALISFAAFHPAVDQLLYAPRVAFGAELFGTIEEPDPDRHGADRARNGIPLGQLVGRKLDDRLGPALEKATARHFQHGDPWPVAAQSVADHDLGYFWKQWIGPHRKLAYRVGAVKLSADGHTAHVTVERLGETWIREPVVVSVLDVDDNEQRAVWDAAGPKGEIEFHTKARYRETIVDPDARLAEDTSLVDGHPRFDNTTRHPWRPPVFSSLGLQYTATEKRLDFDFNFGMRARYDVERGWGLAGARAARGWSGNVRWFENFGRLRDLNYRVAQWSLGAGFLRTPFGFGLEPNPVTEFSLTFTLGWDTRVQLMDPRSGTSGQLLVTPAVARVDGGEPRGTVTLGARYVHLFLEHLRSTTAMLVSVATVLGHAFETQYLGVADRNMLRGFEADELLSRTRAMLIVEQRVRLIGGQFVDIANISWIKSLELAPFATVAAASGRESAFNFQGKGKLVAEAGVGLRLHHEYFGVQPAVLALDFAVPFFRDDPCVRDAAGTCVRERQKYGVYLSAEQTF